MLLDEGDGHRVAVELTLIGCNSGDDRENYHDDPEWNIEERGDPERDCAQDTDGDRVDSERNLEIERGLRVSAYEGSAILQDDVADQRGDEAQEDTTDVDQRCPELLVAGA